jgi:hypothetical protein
VLTLVHPILAVVAVGGLIYAFSPRCLWDNRWPQRATYGAMLFLSLWCPWPAWAIFLACFIGGTFFGALRKRALLKKASAE